MLRTVTNMVLSLLSRDFSHFLLSLFCSSVQNPTQAGAASWQHWSSSIFVYPIRWHLITRVSVRPRDCGITTAANGRCAALCSQQIPQCMSSEDYTVKKKKSAETALVPVVSRVFFQLRLDIRLLCCLLFLFFTQPAKISVPLRWALTVVVEDQSPSWSANTAVEAKISNTDLVIKVSAGGR